MGENTKIEWTDHTMNPWWGCTHVHEGCRHCYAETWAKRFGVKWGPSGVRRLSSDLIWKQPLKWNRAAEKAGVRAKVFCSSMADVFEDWKGDVVDSHGVKLWKFWNSDRIESAVGRPHPKSSPLTLDDVRGRLFKLIDATPWLDWQLLTKRPENIHRMWPSADVFDADSEHKAYWPNVWLGTSVSDQASADKQVPELLKCLNLSSVLFLSCEPLLGPIDLTKVGNHDGTCANLFDGNCLYIGDIGGPDFAWSARNFIKWIIVGGESGNGARPMHPEWARSLRDQCQAARVAFLFKQWGEWDCLMESDGIVVSSGQPEKLQTLRSSDGGTVLMQRSGKVAAGRELDGREWNEFPGQLLEIRSKGDGRLLESQRTGEA